MILTEKSGFLNKDYNLLVPYNIKIYNFILHFILSFTLLQTIQLYIFLLSLKLQSHIRDPYEHLLLCQA